MQDDIVFYLHLDQNLPKYYYTISQYLSKNGITLIPIKPDQVASFIHQSGMMKLIVITSKVGHLNVFKNIVARVVKNAINCGTMTLFHLSSFKSLNLARQHSINSKNYFFIENPVKVKLISEIISRYYWAEKSKAKKWPGGKRAKLPTAS